MAKYGSISAAQVSKYLKGIDFPAFKDDVVEYAKDNNAPEDVISFLSELPDREYSSMADLEHFVGQKK